MRIYLDCEFNDLGPDLPIELISIGMVAEDGREYYAVAADGWRLDHCSPWVRENVLPFLQGPWKTRAQMRRDLEEFCSFEGKKPEIWSYFADYDWVVFVQLFASASGLGRMVDLPENFPMYCRDIKQLMDFYGLKKSDMPKQEGQDHNALADARHHKAMHDFILKKMDPERVRVLLEGWFNTSSSGAAPKCSCGAAHAQPCANCGGLYTHQPTCAVGGHS